MKVELVQTCIKEPDEFPPEWASDWGHDQYGYFMAFTVFSVRQCFRWINPGEFMMGSPEDEPERYKNEDQHRVVLTKGFWLADTACTQALWQAVMRESSSRFKGPARPVENVSWDDCMEFINKLNSLRPGLDLCLPTEAEWEYACRAGTTTPFSFGKSITSDQVNYDGNYPYAGGKKGQYREKTVDVKSLPPNLWGVYEMHGNVYEWCADWYGDYPKKDTEDPTGPESGGNRVLRGGSWDNDGGNVRSASRLRIGPGNRNVNTGFRLSRGQKGCGAR